MRPKSGEIVVVTEIPSCDFCDQPGRYDCRTKYGPWAHCCYDHYLVHRASPHLGVGNAQAWITPDEVDADIRPLHTFTTREESHRMSDETYNGWRNYPTWAVHLWLTNDQGSEEWALEVTRENLGGEHPRYDVSQALRDAVREEYEPDDATLGADLLGYAFDCVDWYEIADAFIEMAAEVPA
jgi:hypothetical protein